MNDALGQSLLDEWTGVRKEKLWTDAPNFAPEEFPVPHLMRTYEGMPQLERDLLGHARGRVLDIGAAAGGHSLHLQDRGLEVEALELSPGACEVMRHRGVKQVHEADLWNFQPKSGYDSIVLLMNGLGLAGTLDRLPAFLLHLRRWLNPGGQLIFDSSDVTYLYEGVGTPDDRYYGEFRYRLRYKAVLSSWFPWVFVDPEQLKRVLAEVQGTWSLRLDGPHYDYGGLIRWD